jgi:hypothetical protein
MSQQINLYNAAFRKQRKHFSSATMLQAMGALLAASFLLYAYQAHQNRTLERAAVENERLLLASREQLRRLTQELADRASDRSIAEDLMRAEERLLARRGLLGELRTGAGGNAQGFSGYLAALARRTVPGVWLTGIEMGKSTDLVLRGRVLQSDLVPVYIKGLNAEEPFAGRSVRELTLTAHDGAAAAQPSQPAQAALTPQSFVEFVMSMPL